jgi:hypothetical protein
VSFAVDGTPLGPCRHRCWQTVVGGGQTTHDDALKAAAEAIAFALEAEPKSDDGSQFEYLDIAVG